MTNPTDQVDVALALELRGDRGLQHDIKYAVLRAIEDIARDMGLEVSGQIAGSGRTRTVSMTYEQRSSCVDDLPIAELVGPTRVRNLLLGKGIRTIGNLCQWSEKELHGIHRLGRADVADIKTLLRRLNRELQPNND